MRAAAHALAMGVEHQRGDITEAVRSHRLGEAALKALDRESRRHLPDKASGIGETGLHRHTAALAG